MSSASAPIGYRADIDGLRAVAVTSVVLFHAGVPPFSSGYVGVDIFFVISGFLIGGIIWREASAGRFGFAAFYARRARRILPALLLVVGCSLAFGALLLSPSELLRLGGSAASALAAASNVRFWRIADYFSPDARADPMLMTWSLGVEEQFYVLFPLLLLGLRRRGPGASLACLLVLSAASFALSVWLASKAPAAGFYLLPARAWELGAGAMLAIWRERRGSFPARRFRHVTGAAGLAAVAASLAVFDERTPFPGCAALLPVLGAAALIASEGSRLNRSVLGHAVPRAIGSVSYSWYLWHWPMMVFLRDCCVGPPPAAALLLAAGASLLAAFASWRLVEQPFRRRTLADKAFLPRYALAMAAASCVAVGVRLDGGAPWRLSPELAAMERTVSIVHGYPCLAGWGRSAPDLGAACVSLAPGGPTAAIIGDSHAAALGPGVQELARRRGWGAMVLAKSSCRPLQGVSVWRRDQPGLAEECARFLEAAFAAVAADPSVRSVILAAQWAGPLQDDRDERYAAVGEGGSGGSGRALLASGLAGAARRLAAAGKQVFVARDVPYWRFDPIRQAIIDDVPPRRLLNRMIEPGAASRGGAPTATRDDATDALLSDAARDGGASFLDLSRPFCADGACRFQQDGTMLYVDRSHLSPQGAVMALSPSASEIFGEGERTSSE